MTTTINSKVRVQRYRLWSYDLWADGDGGMSVNDRYNEGIVEIKVKPTVYNEGTEHEFISWEPTDSQLARVTGAKGCSWDGECEYTLYATCKRTGNPVCELERVSDC